MKKKKFSRKLGGINTKNEFISSIFSTFLENEISNINPNIYLRIEHIEYYKNYHLGNYEWCFKFLIENRNLLQGDPKINFEKFERDTEFL